MFVALRKESVDRNNDDFSVESGEMVSLSARRAWIEITNILWVFGYYSGRSPQGERG